MARVEATPAASNDVSGRGTRGQVASSTTSVEELDLSAWEGTGKFAVVVHGVFTPEECAALIARSESAGYEQALVNMGNGQQMRMLDTRKSDRSIIDDPDFAEELWQRLRAATGDDPRLVRRAGRRKGDAAFHACGLNERLRFLRYGPGDFFASHQDGTYMRRDEAGPERRGECSLLTCQLYLNEGFQGGATRFHDGYDEAKAIDVVPRTGSVLLFEHRLLHEGSLLVAGCKYVIRTDVMFTNKGPGWTYAEKPLPGMSAPPVAAPQPAGHGELDEEKGLKPDNSLHW